MQDATTAARETLLADRLRAGDASVLAELFELHRERLWRMARFRLDRRIAARIDPEDILQEAYLAAAQRADHFRAAPDLSVFLWLRWIVKQTLIDVHRRHLGAQMRDAGRDLSLGLPDLGSDTSACLAARLSGSLTSPSQAAAGRETLEQLERALAQMPEIDQEIIALRHFEDLDNMEVAQLLQLSPTAASNRYVRAIARLKQVLAHFPGLLPE